MRVRVRAGRKQGKGREFDCVSSASETSVRKNQRRFAVCSDTVGCQIRLEEITSDRCWMFLHTFSSILSISDGDNVPTEDKSMRS